MSQKIVMDAIGEIRVPKTLETAIDEPAESYFFGLPTNDTSRLICGVCGEELKSVE